MKREWCRKNASIVRTGKKLIKPRRYRCPDCKKRFMTFIWNCVGDNTFEAACCWSEYLPPHKKVVKCKN